MVDIRSRSSCGPPSQLLINSTPPPLRELGYSREQGRKVLNRVQVRQS